MVVIHMDISRYNEQAVDRLRDEICSALVGNQAFIDNDILVSDCDRPEFLTICLGSDGTEPLDIFVENFCTIGPRKSESS